MHWPSPGTEKSAYRSELSVLLLSRRETARQFVDPWALYSLLVGRDEVDIDFSPSPRKCDAGGLAQIHDVRNPKEQSNLGKVNGIIEQFACDGREYNSPLQSNHV